MIKKIFILLKLARKLALSDALKIVSKIHEPPLIIKIFLGIFSISLFGKTNQNLNLSDEERLCNSIQDMGTTFIKLGQFLSTRPDIIGEKLSKQFEKLQDEIDTGKAPHDQQQALTLEFYEKRITSLETRIEALRDQMAHLKANGGTK